MENDDQRHARLEAEVELLKTERDQLRKQVDYFARILHREANLTGEEAGLQFERDCLASAVSILSGGKYRRLDDDLLDFIKQNSKKSIESTLNDLMKQAS